MRDILTVEKDPSNIGIRPMRSGPRCVDPCGPLRGIRQAASVAKWTNASVLFDLRFPAVGRWDSPWSYICLPAQLCSTVLASVLQFGLRGMLGVAIQYLFGCRTILYQIPKKIFHHGLPMPFALLSTPSTSLV